MAIISGKREWRLRKAMTSISMLWSDVGLYLQKQFFFGLQLLFEFLSFNESCNFIHVHFCQLIESNVAFCTKFRKFPVWVLIVKLRVFKKVNFRGWKNFFFFSFFFFFSCWEVSGAVFLGEITWSICSASSFKTVIFASSGDNLVWFH